MTEKYLWLKFFLSVNISDFNLFLCENRNPPEKSHFLFAINLHLKVEVLSSPPHLFENLVGGSTPRCRKGGGSAHYDPMMEEVSLKIISLIKHN